MTRRNKLKQNGMGNISENNKQEFENRIKKFEYLRQERAARYQGIYIAFFVAAIIILVELVAGQDIFIKIGLILLLMILAEQFYRKSLVQTQKPIFVCENGIGTIEKEPQIVKCKDGKEYVIMSLKDFTAKDEK